MKNERLFTSESVTEGHPDKVCDYISDSILDACLEQDPQSRVACETLCKGGHVVLAGEIGSDATIDFAAVARQAIRDIGYTDPEEPFNADGVEVLQYITQQSGEIAQGVDADRNIDHDQGAGDQGMMFGYATDETPELMPLPILLAHRLAKGLSDDRKSGAAGWLRPDGKTQVTVRYVDNKPVEVTSVLVSTQHSAEAAQGGIADYVRDRLLPATLGDWHRKDITLLVNPCGSFVQGGPSADCGVTGRKIIVDTYGGMAPHGGGAFSGKDPSKVDRSAAYFSRYVARQVVLNGYAEQAEIQVSYAIGKAEAQSVYVDTRGTGDDAAALDYVLKSFDFRPAAIIKQLDLLRPIYRETTNYGHFGRAGLPWELS
ncbi:MAG: methionine adenosyltransferase [Verrucomicrobia bacterium]|jgi:S-adenosylmethionine synthetase|nr:methionine adenosyltransferase [Verrucomicrobiota bacterium]